MSGCDQQRDRDRDFERFLTFVDAVVAIAITLLVLPLVDVAGELGDSESVAHLLGDHSSELVAFALSFAVIARLWLIQHQIMRNVVAHDRTATRFQLGAVPGHRAVLRGGPAPDARLLLVELLAPADPAARRPPRQPVGPVARPLTWRAEALGDSERRTSRGTMAEP